MKAKHLGVLALAVVATAGAVTWPVLVEATDVPAEKNATASGEGASPEQKKVPGQSENGQAVGGSGPAGKSADTKQAKTLPAACKDGVLACQAQPGQADLADVLIAALLVGAILGTVVAVGRLSKPSASADSELKALRENQLAQLDRSREELAAARAWGLRAFELLATVNLANAAPMLAVLGVEPAAGPAEIQVRIFGRGFEPGAKVLIAGVAAGDVAYVSATELTAKAPTLPAKGAAVVTVLGPTGRAASLDAAFTSI